MLFVFIFINFKLYFKKGCVKYNLKEYSDISTTMIFLPFCLILHHYVSFSYSRTLAYDEKQLFLVFNAHGCECTHTNMGILFLKIMILFLGINLKCDKDKMIWNFVNSWKRSWLLICVANLFNIVDLFLTLLTFKIFLRFYQSSTW